MKPSKEKLMERNLPLSVIVILVCALAFAAIIYSEDLGAIAGASIPKFTPPKQDLRSNSTAGGEGEEDYNNEKMKLDPEKCDVVKGKWVFNSSVKPSYSDESCPYLDKQVSCIKNGRPDTDYQFWQWQPDECNLPRLDPAGALKKLRGKRLMFVGDSLQKGQWRSFVCLVQSIIPSDQKSMIRGRALSVFKAKEYNASIEFYWAPFLVESNSDLKIIGDPNKRILRVDSVLKHAKNWTGVDILVFNTYVWWMSGQKIKSLWGPYPYGEDGFEELDVPIAYQISLKTWANWIDSNINPNKTRVFFTTVSPTHMRSVDWHNKKGIRCYNEKRPVLEKGYWGTGSDRRLMKVVAGIVERMKTPVTFLNITQLSEYRKDGHASVYTESHGKVLTDEQKSDPQRYADCIHWCLPGVPDTWNQLFYAYL